MKNCFRQLRNYLREQSAILDPIDFSPKLACKKVRFFSVLAMIIVIIAFFIGKIKADYKVMAEFLCPYLWNLTGSMGMFLTVLLLYVPLKKIALIASPLFDIAFTSGIFMFWSLFVQFLEELITTPLPIRQKFLVGSACLLIFFVFLFFNFVLKFVQCLAENDTLLEKLDIRVRFTFFFIPIIYLVLIKFYV